MGLAAPPLPMIVWLKNKINSSPQNDQIDVHAGRGARGAIITSWHRTTRARTVLVSSNSSINFVSTHTRTFNKNPFSKGEHSTIFSLCVVIPIRIHFELGQDDRDSRKGHTLDRARLRPDQETQNLHRSRSRQHDDEGGRGAIVFVGPQD